MIKRIALLRGINVGGHKKVIMAELRLHFTNAGFKNVRTYIQSGNIIFDSNTNESNNEVEIKINQLITKNYNFKVPIIINTISEFENFVADNPFTDNVLYDIENLFITFLNKVPQKQNILSTESFNFSPDKFYIKGKVIFGYCAGKYHKSKLTNNFFEKELSVSCTTRNIRTVNKLIELSKL